jgi:hypothetical protein
MRADINHLRTRLPGARIRAMPHNNPGFDIEVDGETAIRFVEVKGTQASMPRFFITEGERQFARANRPSYLLLVVYDIDRMSDRYRLLEHEAADLKEAFVLTPRQWVGTGFEQLRCGAGFLSHLGFSVLLDVTEHPSRCVPSARPSPRPHICLARNR